MKQIILMRHAQDILSAKKIKKTSADDCSLSQLGEKQALQIKKFLQKYNYEVIFTSLYRRSIKTADLVKTKNVSVISSIAFNDYYTRPNGEDVETTSMGIARAVAKIYSVFDLYESVLLVGHDNINKTILRAFLNNEYEEAGKYFNKYGETHVLRRDWRIGDKTWRIIDSFVPQQ